MARKPQKFLATIEGKSNITCKEMKRRLKNGIQAVILPHVEESPESLEIHEVHVQLFKENQ